jgi:predicted nicotinamide N-methyase
MGFAGTVAAAMGHRVLLADIETPALLFAKLNTLPYAPRVGIRKLNWQRDHLNEQFDLIIGADVVYERAQWEHLEPFWREHVAPQGVVLLGEPGRGTGDLFGEWITNRGWTLKLFEQAVPARKNPIRLFQLTR